VEAALDDGAQANTRQGRAAALIEKVT